VDTGADITALPARLASELHLPVVGEVRVRGVTGAQRALLYGVELQVAGARVMVQAAGVGAHTLLGRDVLNRWTLVFRGPEQMLEVDTAGA